MRWNVVALEITPDDVFYICLADGCVELELMGDVRLVGSSATLSSCHIQGPGPNIMGHSALRQVARWAMERLDVNELRIEGAARTTGANPGRRPAALVFRRTGHAGTAA